MRRAERGAAALDGAATPTQYRNPILDDAPPFDPLADVEGVERIRTLWERLRFALTLQDVTDDLGIADTGQLLSGDLTGPTPGLVHRADGAGLLYPGRVHFLVGEPETFKTFLAGQFSLEVIAAGKGVVFIDYEQTGPQILARLLTLGGDPDTLGERFVYIRPEGRLDTHGEAIADAFAQVANVALVVVDGVTEMMVAHGWDPISNADAARLGKLLTDLGRSGAAVLALDHVVKNRDQRGRGPIGAGHKLAAADVSYSIRVATRPDPTREGLLILRVDKDRHGAIRAAAPSGIVARVKVLPDADGMGVFFEPPDESEDGWQPTMLMDRVVDFLESQRRLGNDAMSLRRIREGVHGKAAYIDRAVEELIADGRIIVKKGPRGANLHRLVEDGEGTSEDLLGEAAPW
jgi:hypothetical protein